MISDADALVDRVAADGDAIAAQRLLKELLRGLPVESLRPVLRSDHEAAVKAGVWIASELAERAAPLLGDIVPLLEHPARYVRFFAVDVVLLSAEAWHGEALGSAIRRIEDADSAVRWKATNFLARATGEQLEAALPYLEPRLRGLLHWLMQSDRGAAESEVLGKLESSEPADRLFAAAAAARLFDREPTILQGAADSGDEEVRSFAREKLREASR